MEAAPLVERKPTSKKFIDRTGQTFGCLTVESFAGFLRTFSVWNCRCECGSMRTVFGTTFYRKPPPQCHCKRLSGHRLYGIWSQMIQRCTNSNIPAFKDYGGRGIRVCDRWQWSFQAFLDDMGPRPSPSHSIDRINNSGNYEPGNCRWATPREQTHNTRRNRWIEFNGERMIVSDWARRLGLTPERLRQRLNKWPLAKALSPKIERRGGYGMCGRYKKAASQYRVEPTA